MYLFIAIIFIAELIIAGAVLNFIIKTDRKVCAMNNKVIAFIPEFEAGLNLARSIINNLDKGVHSVVCIIQKKKKAFISKVIITIAMYLSLLFFKGRYKKAAVFFQMLALIKDYMDNSALSTCKI